jgi:hypothetical protein
MKASIKIMNFVFRQKTLASLFGLPGNHWQDRWVPQNNVKRKFISAFGVGKMSKEHPYKSAFENYKIAIVKGGS